MKKLPALFAAMALLAGCASLPSDAELDQMSARIMRSSFRDQGIAKVDRLDQDFVQAACSGGKAPDEASAARIRAEAAASVKRPADGQYLGDWREGEKLAQSGRGMTWTDASTAPAANGGNCYNCHQIAKEEISYGTIGPSLYHYGRDRGITGSSEPQMRALYEYTWTKLYNAHAFVACSSMPRFGAKGLLDDKQLKHLMALLLDPNSPVNR